ncbi:hypothetical protein LIER_09671 [Lithospermum erythrorhizon]|uniref:Uncharacterized protein n=1 Tax=Lithospermum erythrorhizon TaxID=34254 RepID=A0AAV3PGG5_LITER
MKTLYPLEILTGERQVWELRECSCGYCIYFPLGVWPSSTPGVASSASAARDDVDPSLSKRLFTFWVSL